MAHGVKLDGLSMEELQSLISDAQRALASKVDAKRQELQKELDALNAISSPAKSPNSPSRQRAAPAAKYRSKANLELSWAGRGGRPRWLTAEMEETGQPLEYFAV